MLIELVASMFAETVQHIDSGSIQRVCCALLGVVCVHSRPV